MIVNHDTGHLAATYGRPSITEYHVNSEGDFLSSDTVRLAGKQENVDPMVTQECTPTSGP